ncbi:MAG: hypothetical protein LBH24_02080, partial [Clostridiales bacterium]|nr:hypothetical protein [Clostridiales bacterium]
LVFNLIDPGFLRGNITAITLAAGGFGLALFLVLWLNRRAEQKNEQYERERRQALAEEEAAAQAAAGPKPPPDPPEKSDAAPEEEAEADGDDRADGPSERAARKPAQPPAQSYPLKRGKRGKKK